MQQVPSPWRASVERQPVQWAAAQRHPSAAVPQPSIQRPVDVYEGFYDRATPRTASNALVQQRTTPAQTPQYQLQGQHAVGHANGVHAVLAPGTFVDIFSESDGGWVPATVTEATPQDPSPVPGAVRCVYTYGGKKKWVRPEDVHRLIRIKPEEMQRCITQPPLSESFPPEPPMPTASTNPTVAPLASQATRPPVSFPAQESPTYNAQLSFPTPHAPSFPVQQPPLLQGTAPEAPSFPSQQAPGPQAMAPYAQSFPNQQPPLPPATSMKEVGTIPNPQPSFPPQQIAPPIAQLAPRGVELQQPQPPQQQQVPPPAPPPPLPPPPPPPPPRQSGAASPKRMSPPSTAAAVLASQQPSRPGATPAQNLAHRQGVGSFHFAPPPPSLVPPPPLRPSGPAAPSGQSPPRTQSNSGGAGSVMRQESPMFVVGSASSVPSSQPLGAGLRHHNPEASKMPQGLSEYERKMAMSPALAIPSHTAPPGGGPSPGAPQAAAGVGPPRATSAVQSTAEILRTTSAPSGSLGHSCAVPPPQPPQMSLAPPAALPGQQVPTSGGLQAPPRGLGLMDDGAVSRQRRMWSTKANVQQYVSDNPGGFVVRIQ